jgi:hypothetical protein
VRSNVCVWSEYYKENAKGLCQEQQGDEGKIYKSKLETIQGFFQTAGGRVVEKRGRRSCSSNVRGMFVRKSMLNVCSLARETDG